jgi:hypothetical protein
MRKGLPVLLAASTVGVVGACARQGAPPGGPQDRRPPVVVTTVPDTFAVDSTFRGPVRFDFDERISERPSSGTLDGAVLVSPRTGEVRVSHSRAGIKVDLAGGFKKGLVYRVTVLPVFKDMFNNQMRDPFELVFSTGAPFVNSALAGMVWDRITGQPLKDMEVRAVSEADSASYFALSDTAGIYAFRYLPPARYRLTAFEDRNQNYEVDRTEPRGERVVLLSGPDTLLPLDISTLQPDTGQARVRAAEVLDSLTLLVSFDRFIDPDEPATRMSATISRDSGSAPKVVHVYQEYAYSRWVEAVRDSVARADSLAAAERAREEGARRAAEERRAAADTAARDTTRTVPHARPATTARDTGAVRDTTAQVEQVRDTVAQDTATHVVQVGDTVVRDTALHILPPPDSAARPGGTAPSAPDTGKAQAYLPPRLPGASASAGPRAQAAGGGGLQDGLGPDGNPLPKQRIVLVLDSALIPNVDYLVTVQGVTTVNGVPLGGGDAHFTRQPPKDTTKAAGDSTVVTDTSVVRDTSVVPDTSVDPDTSRVPDTSRTAGRIGSAAESRGLPYPLVPLPERRRRR